MRGFLAGLLLAIGLVLVPLADLGVWTQRQLLPTAAFSDLATEVLDEPDVQAALAERLTEEIVNRQPGLRVSEGVINPAIQRAIDTQAFEGVFRVSVGDMHAQLKRGDDQLTLNFDAILPIVRAQVASVDADVADRIPTSGVLPSITVITRDEVPQAWVAVNLVRRASWAFPAITLGLLGLAVLLAQNRARMLLIAGLGIVFVAVALIAVIRLGRDPLSDVVGSQVSEEAFDSGYGVVTRSLVTQTVVLGLIGVASAVGGIAWMVSRDRNARPSAWA